MVAFQDYEVLFGWLRRKFLGLIQPSHSSHARSSGIGIVVPQRFAELDPLCSQLGDNHSEVLPRLSQHSSTDVLPETRRFSFFPSRLFSNRESILSISTTSSSMLCPRYDASSLLVWTNRRMAHLLRNNLREITGLP